MKEIKIDKCLNCPFANNDNEFGMDYCNLGEFDLSYPDTADNIHYNCPLKKESVIVKL